MHVFARTQTLATLQAEIFQVSQLLFVFFYFPPPPMTFFFFFCLGRTKLLRLNCTIGWLAEQPWTTTALLPAAHSKQVWRVSCKSGPCRSRTRAQAHTTSFSHLLLLFLLTPFLFFFFLPSHLVKKEKNHLGNKAFLKDRKTHVC